MAARRWPSGKLKRGKGITPGRPPASGKKKVEGVEQDEDQDGGQPTETVPSTQTQAKNKPKNVERSGKQNERGQARQNYGVNSYTTSKGKVTTQTNYLHMFISTGVLDAKKTRTTILKIPLPKSKGIKKKTRHLYIPGKPGRKFQFVILRSMVGG